jgi:hypothetical protein
MAAELLNNDMSGCGRKALCLTSELLFCYWAEYTKEKNEKSQSVNP